MVDFFIVSGVLLTAPLWAVAYDYIDGRYTDDENEQEEVDSET